MNRLFLALALLTVTSFSSGCAMCCSPYDDCGPVYDDGYCRNELIDGRAGSAFTAEKVPAEPAEEGEVYYEDE